MTFEQNVSFQLQVFIFCNCLYQQITIYIYYWFIYSVTSRGYGLKMDFKALFYRNPDLFSHKIVSFSPKAWNSHHDMHLVWFHNSHINYNGKNIISELIKRLEKLISSCFYLKFEFTSYIESDMWNFNE